MSLDLIRTNERMPDLASAQKTGDEKIAELENYLIQLRDQIGWELDRLRTRLDGIEKTVQVLAGQGGENSGEIMALFSMMPQGEEAETMEEEEPQEEVVPMEEEEPGNPEELQTMETPGGGEEDV